VADDKDAKASKQKQTQDTQALTSHIFALAFSSFPFVSEMA